MSKYITYLTAVPVFLNITQRRAQANHVCDSCKKAIPRGSRYKSVRGKFKAFDEKDTLIKEFMASIKLHDECRSPSDIEITDNDLIEPSETIISFEVGYYDYDKKH